MLQTTTKYNGQSLSRNTTIYNSDGTKQEDRIQYWKNDGSMLPTRKTKYTYDEVGRLVKTEYPVPTKNYIRAKIRMGISFFEAYFRNSKVLGKRGIRVFGKNKKKSCYFQNGD